jgi:hypothetical protein
MSRVSGPARSRTCDWVSVKLSASCTALESANRAPICCAMSESSKSSKLTGTKAAPFLQVIVGCNSAGASSETCSASRSHELVTPVEVTKRFSFWALVTTLAISRSGETAQADAIRIAGSSS